MKTHRLTAALFAAAALISTSALAQTIVGGQAPTPNEVIYLPQLPAAGDLTQSAAAQGMTVASIQQMDGLEIAVFRLPNGQTNTVAYRLLSAAGSGEASASLAAAPGSDSGPVAGPNQNPAVVYATPTPAPYYDYDYPAGYYPWGWYSGPYLGYGYGFGFRGGYRAFGGGFGFRGGAGFRGTSVFRGSAGFRGGGGGGGGRR